MDQLSPLAEHWIRLLEDQFWLIIANLELHAQDGTTGEHPSPYASPTDARRAMLRLAYLKGQADLQPPRDFDEDLKRVEASRHRHARATDRLLK